GFANNSCDRPRTMAAPARDGCQAGPRVFLQESVQRGRTIGARPERFKAGFEHIDGEPGASVPLACRTTVVARSPDHSLDRRSPRTPWRPAVSLGGTVGRPVPQQG